MRKALIYLIVFITSVSVASAQDVPDTSSLAGDTLVMPGRMIPMEGVFLTPLQERDSVLIADQLLYGFELRQIEEGTQFALPEWENDGQGGVIAVSDWLVDTIKVSKARNGKPRLMDIRAAIKVTSFDAGEYVLPSIMAQRLSKDGVTDTLIFEPMRVEVKTIPVDTATFVPHDIKGQIRYPLTVKEILVCLSGYWLVMLVIILIMCLVLMRRRKQNTDIYKEPAHIVALRKLDKYRGNKMWVAEKQKEFYSGVTDALREYIAGRYGISAMEMTTAEIFDDMKVVEIPAELYSKVKELFERADFVKFAKYVASDEDNASALPVAVRFVTETYQRDVAESSAGTSSEVPEGESVSAGAEDDEKGGNE